MNINFDIQELIKILIFIGFLYALIRGGLFFVKERIGKSNVRWQKNWIRKIEILITPVTIAAFIVLSLTMNYIWTGLLVLIGYFAFREPIENYFYGIYFKLNSKLDLDSSISVGEVSGTIREYARIGIWLNTDRGLRFVTYKNLYTKGFTINNSSHISRLFEMVLVGKDGIDTARLRSLLQGSPYLDGNQRLIIERDEDKIKLKLNLRNRDHFQEVMAFLRENNYKVIY